MFFVQNTDGPYEYYTAEKKPQRIGDKAYANAGYFIEDVAPVAEPERHISFIRRDGTQAFMLDYYLESDAGGAIHPPGRSVDGRPFETGLSQGKLQPDLRIER